MKANDIKIIGYPILAGTSFEFKSGKKKTIKSFEITNDNGTAYVYVYFKEKEPTQ